MAQLVAEMAAGRMSRGQGVTGRTFDQTGKELRSNARATGGNAINASARASVHDTAVIAKRQGAEAAQCRSRGLRARDRDPNGPRRRLFAGGSVARRHRRLSHTIVVAAR